MVLSSWEQYGRTAWIAISFDVTLSCREPNFCKLYPVEMFGLKFSFTCDQPF